MKEQVRFLVRSALQRAAERGRIPPLDAGDLRIEVSRSREPRFGDYATNVALVLAGTMRMKPRDLAEIISENLSASPDVLERSEVAGPGFINFFMSPSVWLEVLNRVHAEREAYGRSAPAYGRRVLLEFVSANPTGPLHVGHGRGAAVGDTLGRLLKTCGYDLRTEYYVNDAGNQMKILGRSVLLRFRELLGE
ncbi:MAG: arginine--tRNA ligase, partial [Deltaproteobacteria bacterium]|nr:arginine--tRNA ligase [Deltaproteobacteria bacterium]